MDARPLRDIPFVVHKVESTMHVRYVHFIVKLKWSMTILHDVCGPRKGMFCTSFQWPFLYYTVQRTAFLSQLALSGTLKAVIISTKAKIIFVSTSLDHQANLLLFSHVHRV